MFDWLMWFTQLDNSKTCALVLLFSTFCAILFYVFTGKRRSQRLESYKYIPLQDDDVPATPFGKVTDDERENH